VLINSCWTILNLVGMRITRARRIFRLAYDSSEGWGTRQIGQDIYGIYMRPKWHSLPVGAISPRASARVLPQHAPVPTQGYVHQPVPLECFEECAPEEVWQSRIPSDFPTCDVSYEVRLSIVRVVAILQSLNHLGLEGGPCPEPSPAFTNMSMSSSSISSTNMMDTKSHACRCSTSWPVVMPAPAKKWRTRWECIAVRLADPLLG
jgi:hypothetical protein